MIFTREMMLMGRQKWEDLTPELQANCDETLEKVNIILQAYLATHPNKKFKMNDGLRRQDVDKPKNGATHSGHYAGFCIDVDDDETGWLWNWLMKPEVMQLLKDTGIWLEHGNYTHNKKYGTWVHMGIRPPKSGKRIYVPSAEPDPNPSFWNGHYDPKFN